MQVNIIEEAGYSTALYGFSLSYKDRAIPRDEWWCSNIKEEDLSPGGCKLAPCDYCSIFKREEQTQKTATANAGRGMGHDKWLRQVIVFLDVEAPRYWWSEMDTYKVGTVAQSESTMHTILKRDITANDFEGEISYFDFKEFNLFRKSENCDIQSLKQELPESYLQRRVVSLNYAVLRCIIDQRKNHALPEWWTFIKNIYSQCQHIELLPNYEEVLNVRKRQD